MSMNVSRRGLFGITAGMAAAGPSAVKSALATLGDASNKIAVPSLYPPMPDYGYIKDAVPVSDGHWLQSELTHMLKRRKSVEIASPVLCQVDDMRIDGLRSISQVSRARMIAEARMRRDIENELSYLNEKISELKKQIGPLALIGEVLE